MEKIKKFEEWRAEEVVKVFLLKSGVNLSIEKYPTPLFDFFIQLKDDSMVRFAIEVKNKDKFKSRINKQLAHLITYRESGMLNIPVLIIKVDEEKETGEYDFMVFPSFKEKKLLIRKEFKFEELNKENFNKTISTIIKWFKQ